MASIISSIMAIGGGGSLLSSMSSGPPTEIAAAASTLESCRMLMSSRPADGAGDATGDANTSKSVVAASTGREFVRVNEVVERELAVFSFGIKGCDPARHSLMTCSFGGDDMNAAYRQ